MLRGGVAWRTAVLAGVVALSAAWLPLYDLECFKVNWSWWLHNEGYPIICESLPSVGKRAALLASLLVVPILESVLGRRVAPNWGRSKIAAAVALANMVGLMAWELIRWVRFGVWGLSVGKVAGMCAFFGILFLVCLAAASLSRRRVA